MRAEVDHIMRTALDEDGNLINIEDAVKGCMYTCIGCRKRVFPKKGAIRAHHFAHESDSRCDYDHYKHEVFKRKVFELLSQRIKERKPFYVAWLCDQCGEVHKADILSGVSSVKMEYPIWNCRPDIALFQGRWVSTVIEVVVTHEPEEAVLKFYKSKGIMFIRITVWTDEDIKDFEKRLAWPDTVRNKCTAPKCRQCGEYMHRTSLTVAEVKCSNPRCGKSMLVAFSNEENKIRTPDKFTAEQIQVAKDCGVNLDTKANGTRSIYDLSNKCNACNWLYPNTRLKDYLKQNNAKVKVKKQFYECRHCKPKWHKPDTIHYINPIR